jgi:hypothetical protein
MASKFMPGAKAYAKDGKAYIVEEVDGGIVYCRTTGGAETEFPEAALQTEAEWTARSSGKRDLFYTRLKQSRPYTTPAGKFDGAAAARALAKAEKLSPGLLDFTAVTVASRVMSEEEGAAAADQLSVIKCREVFDAAKPEISVGLLAGLLSMTPQALVDAGGLGDNLMRALVEKGLAPHAEAFDEFLDRPRR